MNVNFQKFADGLVPSIIQDSVTLEVLMLGFMSDESLIATQRSGKVTFFSRSRQRLWEKGETSGNFLYVESIVLDCDGDTLLIKARPNGPVCHTGSRTCFGGTESQQNFLFELEKLILARKNSPTEDSYTSDLFASGLNRIAQKVGEESVELIIEAKDSDDERFRSEAADLLYHLLILLAAKEISLANVIETLKQRSK